MTAIRSAAIGAFVLGGVLLFAFGLFLIGDRRLLFERHFELNTTFGKVTGLQIGSKVRVSGFDAGEVLEVAIPSRPSDPFRVRMRIRDDLRPLLRADSVSAVQTDGIVGNAFIQISRGTDAAPSVAPGDTIQGRDPVEFADLIAEGRETFQTVSRQIVEVTDEVAAAIDPLVQTASLASGVVTSVGGEVTRLTAASAEAADEVRALVSDARGLVTDVRAGRGTIGRLLTDDAAYERWVGISREAEQTLANLQTTTARTRDLMQGLTAPQGAAQQIVQTMRDAVVDAREVVLDLSEGTEALKHHFLFRGFFRDRGFFDLDALSRDQYLAGALEQSGRIPLRIWIEAAGLFARTADGAEQLTDAGRRRVEAAMADLVRYARDSPLVVEGYALGTEGQAPYLLSSDRALLVRDYLVSRFRRRVTLTGVMPIGSQATASPRPDDQWSGVALTLFVRPEEVVGQ
jgi:phospholipid/cholesterol/gamma-HCH transport system substrate-binding protein